MSGGECRVCGYHHTGEGCVIDDALVRKLVYERDEARAEVERLREDAKRYRWLWHHYTAAVTFAHPKVIVIDDASIDEAMREGEG